MVSKFENYTTGADGDMHFESTNWRAQTFKVGATGHTITSVKLLLYRAGSPGTITVGIRAVDANGHPTGSDLTSGTTNGNTLTTDPFGELREIAVTEYTLAPNTKYAIVPRAPNGSWSSNIVEWRLDLSSPAYGDGNYETSTDGGASWSADTGKDFMFEIWGNVIVVAPTVTTQAATAIGLD